MKRLRSLLIAFLAVFQTHNVAVADSLPFDLDRGYVLSPQSELIGFGPQPLSSGLALFDINRLSWDNSINVCNYGGESYALVNDKVLCAWTGGNVGIYNRAGQVLWQGHLSVARGGIQSVTVGSKVIFAGSSTAVDIYDDTTASWSTGSLSQARSDMAIASANGITVFAGGATWAPYTTYDTVDIYDSINGTWKVSHLPHPLYNPRAAAAAGGKVFIAGGGDELIIYDTLTDSWSTAMLPVARDNPTAVALGSKVFFVGGVSSNVVDIFDTDSEMWSTSQLPRTVNTPLVGGAGDYIVVVTSEYSLPDPVLYYHSTDGTWGGTPDYCLDDPAKRLAGICGCGTPDTDTDHDGTADCLDQCKYDSGKIADADTDQDGVIDCVDACPTDALKSSPGACGCGATDTDVNTNGVTDCTEQCLADPTKSAVSDSDKDGLEDCYDGCPADPQKKAPGACGCGTPDTDTNKNGIADCTEHCLTDPTKSAVIDSDGDGTEDCYDECPADPQKIKIGYCGCGFVDTDANQNGVPDCTEIGVTINGAAIYTNSPGVKLAIVYPPGTEKILVSNDGGFTGSSSVAPTSSLDWKLQESGSERIPKIIYVRFVGTGLPITTYTDDIILDQTAPIVESAIAKSAVSFRTLVTSKTTKTRTYRLSIRAKDRLSGVAWMQFSNSSRWLPFKRTTSISTKPGTLRIRVKDSAGNLSKAKYVRLR